MEQEETILLHWSDFQKSAATSFQNARASLKYCDITLVCDDDDTLIEAHKVILASGSTFFQHILDRSPGDHLHPLLFLAGVGRSHLEAVLDFLYSGQARLPQGDLIDFLKAAQTMGVRGLQKPELQEHAPISRTFEDIGIQDVDVVDTENYINRTHKSEDKFHIPEPSRRKKSGVWKFFEKKGNVEDYPNGAKCKVCDKMLSYNSVSMSTTGLWDHMKQKHENVMKKGSRENFMLEMNLNKLDKSVEMPIKQELVQPDSSSKVLDYMINTDIESQCTEQNLDNPENIEDPISTSHFTIQKQDNWGRSPVWEFVDKLDGGLAKCKVCDKVMVNRAGSTTALIAHIMNTHTETEAAYILKQNMEQKKELRSKDLNGEALSYIDEISYSEDKFAIKDIDKNSMDFERLGSKEQWEISNDENQELFEKPNKSPIWQFMERIDDKNAKCKICQKLLSSKGGVTSGLMSHVLSTHRTSSAAGLLKKKRSIKANSKQLKYLEDQEKSIYIKDMVMRLSENKWQCKVCAKISNSEPELNRHVVKHM